jgi:hypothetical protein
VGPGLGHRESRSDLPLTRVGITSLAFTADTPWRSVTYPHLTRSSFTHLMRSPERVALGNRERWQGCRLAVQACAGASLAQCVSGGGSSAALRSVVDELVRFRLKVRQYALTTPEATREARQQQLQERRPLLEACDALRRDLAAHGISIKVSVTTGEGTSDITHTERIEARRPGFPRNKPTPMAGSTKLSTYGCEDQVLLRPSPPQPHWPSVGDLHVPLLRIQLCRDTKAVRTLTFLSPGQRWCDFHMGTAGPQDKTAETRELRTEPATGPHVTLHGFCAFLR